MPNPVDCKLSQVSRISNPVLFVHKQSYWKEKQGFDTNLVMLMKHDIVYIVYVYCVLCIVYFDIVYVNPKVYFWIDKN